MNGDVQTGVAMAAIALISSVAGMIVGYFKDRDKLKYDAEFASLKNQNANQAKQIADSAGTIAVLQRDQQECLERHQECLDQHEQTERRLKALEESLSKKPG